MRIAFDHVCECTDTVVPSGGFGLRSVLGVIAALTLVAACTGVDLPPPFAPEPVAEEHMPLWAGITIVGDPEVAERDIELEIQVMPEAERLRTTTIPSGTVIRWEEGLSDGPYRLLGEGGRCVLDIVLPPEQRTTVALRHDATGCAFAMVGDQPPVEGGSVAALVTVQPWDGLLVEAASMDTPAQPVPDPVPPDEGGLAQLGSLYPGRYAIRLRRAEAVLESQEITVVDGGPPGQTIQLTFDGIVD